MESVKMVQRAYRPGRQCCGRRRRGNTRSSLHVSWQGNHCSRHHSSSHGRLLCASWKAGSRSTPAILVAGRRRQLRSQIRPRNQGRRRRRALNRLTLHLLQQQWRGQNIHICRQMSHRLLHLLLNPVIPGFLMLTVRKVQCGQKHSVRLGMVEDPGMQTDRKHQHF
ncbi:hypothetical protein AMECASPLE_006399 [Ameca splendens]|uniref:Uncharacterized protein n=1 Tax=Ameca splendens TaxID=208324 RepID=A0ABV0XZB7_9TELE